MKKNQVLTATIMIIIGFAGLLVGIIGDYNVTASVWLQSIGYVGTGIFSIGVGMLAALALRAKAPAKRRKSRKK